MLETQELVDQTINQSDTIIKLNDQLQDEKDHNGLIIMNTKEETKQKAKKKLTKEIGKLNAACVI